MKTLCPPGRQAIACFSLSLVIFTTSFFSGTVLGFSSELFALTYWGPGLYFCLLNFIFRYCYQGFMYEVISYLVNIEFIRTRSGPRLDQEVQMTILIWILMRCLRMDIELDWLGTRLSIWVTNSLYTTSLFFTTHFKTKRKCFVSQAAWKCGSFWADNAIPSCREYFPVVCPA